MLQEVITPSIQFNKLEIGDDDRDRKGKKAKGKREQKKDLLKKVASGFQTLPSAFSACFASDHSKSGVSICDFDIF